MSDDDERIAPRSPREETPACSSDDADETGETKDVANKATVQGGAAPRRFKTRNLVVGVAACAVAFCALITGIGYGLGWFSGDESTDENPASAFVGDSANQSNGDQTAESALDQDADTAEEADAVNAGDNADADEGYKAGEQGESNESDETGSDIGSDTSQGLENETGNVSTEQNGNTASGDSSGNSGNAAASSLSGTTNSGTSENSGSGSSPSASLSGQDSSPSTQNSNRDSASSGTSNTGNTNSASDTISVSIYIDSSRAVPYGWEPCLVDTTVTVADGSSVYDALKATGLAIGGSGSYVASISGLAERACGSGSGWLYYVNGVSPGYSCSQYKLSGGEDIKWIYTCDMGNDI